MDKIVAETLGYRTKKRPRLRSFHNSII